MVQTLMGEATGQSAAGSTQYADNESGLLRNVGAPGGAKITNATLDHEANLMASTMLNQGHIGDSGVYKGLSNGVTVTAQAQHSNEGSALCTQLHRDINAVNGARSGQNKSTYTQWRSVVQGHGRHAFVRELQPGGTRVARTDFF